MQPFGVQDQGPVSQEIPPRIWRDLRENVRETLNSWLILRSEIKKTVNSWLELRLENLFQVIVSQAKRFFHTVYEILVERIDSSQHICQNVTVLNYDGLAY